MMMDNFGWHFFEALVCISVTPQDLQIVAEDVGGSWRTRGVDSHEEMAVL